MRKLFTSSFILLLLLLSLWAVAAWFMGVKIENNVNALIGNTNDKINDFFGYEILSYERSIFTTKANLKLTLNSENNIAKYLENVLEIDTNQTLQLVIFHGPILFDRSGIGLGGSSWKLVFDKLLLDDDSQNNELNDLSLWFSAKIDFDFDHNFTYKIPFNSKRSKFHLNGSYDHKKQDHNGSLIAKDLIYKDLQQTIALKQLEIKYQQTAQKNNENERLELSSFIPEVIYKHSSTQAMLKGDVNYEGFVSLGKNGDKNITSKLNKNNIISSKHKFSLEVKNSDIDPIYPIDSAELLINVNALNIGDLIILDSKIKQLYESKQQSEWILEEQGEYPEGQDQIWLVQDQAINHLKQLPLLLKNTFIFPTLTYKNQLNKNKKVDITSRVNFVLKNNFNNKSSILSGGVYPDLPNIKNKQNELTDNSILSFIQARAEAKLDDSGFSFLSRRFPITKSNFTLFYKQNKLLMQ